MTAEPGIFEVMYTTRAMRRIKPDPVPEELLLKLVDAANQAASASNAQRARWIVVRDPEQRAHIAELNKAAVLASYGPPDPAADTVEARRRNAFLWQTEHMAEVPALIFACLETATPPADTFAAGAASGGSIWPGVQNLLLTARALGLGAVPTTLVLRDRAALRAALNLPETIEPHCMVPVGFPTGTFGPVTRRPVDEIMRWDRWG